MRILQQRLLEALLYTGAHNSADELASRMCDFLEDQNQSGKEEWRRCRICAKYVEKWYW